MWFNPIIIWLLRSPFHILVSKNILLITYKGRKSGKEFSTPVNYLPMNREGEQFLAIISSRDRIWWRNLRDGAPITIRLRGKDYTATANIIEEEESVAKNLFDYLHQWPAVAKYLNVGVDEKNQPNPDEVAEASKSRVFIMTILT